jgi:hypothetical protein
MNRYYRVIRKESPSGGKSYVLYQVHYDENGGIQLVSADPASPHRNTVEELREDLERMSQALELPVLPEEEVMDSLETSGASAYGRWIREQIADSCPEADTRATAPMPRAEQARVEQQRMEAIAATFAEKRRSDPYFDLPAESDDDDRKA